MSVCLSLSTQRLWCCMLRLTKSPKRMRPRPKSSPDGRKNCSLPFKTGASAKGATLPAKEIEGQKRNCQRGPQIPRETPQVSAAWRQTLKCKLSPGRDRWGQVGTGEVLKTIQGDGSFFPLRSQVKRHLLRDTPPRPHHPGPQSPVLGLKELFGTCK